eukprot:TRINITY_DN12562_c0_g1_i2.p1 TRINITY_DN12562_c0_g1~~TRINITY_DN12562_c0_g1_i2.p1  ORF type:complete len:211 (+),score=65.18 TRINITY_DN12562_c0_g1_i2:96-728(+)
MCIRDSGVLKSAIDAGDWLYERQGFLTLPIEINKIFKTTSDSELQAVMLQIDAFESQLEVVFDQAQITKFEEAVDAALGANKWLQSHKTLLHGVGVCSTREQGSSSGGLYDSVSWSVEKIFEATNKKELQEALESLSPIEAELSEVFTVEQHTEWKSILAEVDKCDGWLRGQERFLRDAFSYDYNSAALVFSMNRVSPGGEGEYLSLIHI